MAYLSKAARNAALFADYRKGYSRRQVCRKYGLTEGGLAALFYRHGVTLEAGERLRRQGEGRRKASYRNVGRKSAWPECPPELHGEYMHLRRYMAAGEARARLDPGMQA